MARRFRTLKDCRVYLGDLINRVEAGDLEASVGTRAYVTNILAGLIKDGELEARIEALESALEGPR